jgi:hypothetical protein
VVVVLAWPAVVDVAVLPSGVDEVPVRTRGASCTAADAVDVELTVTVIDPGALA